MATQLAIIQNFLAQKRIAVIGVSRHEKDFSRSVFGELKKRGYDVVPVHNSASMIDGLACCASVTAVSPAPDAALVMTNGDAARQVVQECYQAGIRKVWLYRAVGRGAADPQAIAFCKEHAMEVVEGECPFMFLEGGPWIHSVHGLIRKITGSFPH